MYDKSCKISFLGNWQHNLLLGRVDYIFNFITGWTLIGPYIIGLVPRLVMLFLSFISDYATYQICILYKANFNQCLTTLASSYVMLIYSTRTFSNSIEMVIIDLNSELLRYRGRNMLIFFRVFIFC